jgi:hypothetical protein
MNKTQACASSSRAVGPLSLFPSFTVFACAIAAATFVTVFLAADQAGATPIVKFYNNESSFLAAITNSTVLSFEGIVADNSNHDFGSSYHTGAVTFTSPFHHVLVVGKNSQTLGAPFDSALLIPDTDPGSMLATFDSGSNLTAVGGFFLNLEGDFQNQGTLTLTGSTGVLDVRSVPLGIATSGKPKTFLGYTVTGATISSLSVNIPFTVVAFDDFTYGTAVPEPASVSLVILGGFGLLLIRHKRRLYRLPSTE